MKTLKRTLCLVLALVLALGTMGVASAAYDDFTDADEINAKYAEAVEVTTALGIIDGMTDTTFVPDGNLTRAQAAKIISYIMFGDAASLIVPSETKFTDVPADYWASGYIAALSEVGVIAGMTDTTFAPNATLTGHQWAKMLLCAMGYAGNLLTGYDEIFEGQFWTANVAKYAREAGLLAVMEDDYFLGDVITREEAVQMGFYAMLNPYANPVKTSVIQLVPDGKGGYILKVVITDIESLAWENYGLGVFEGNIIETPDGYILDDVILTEDVAASEGRHAYVWATLNVKTGEFEQLTDVNLLDAYTEVTAEDIAAYAKLKDAERAAYIKANFDADVYVYTNNSIDNYGREYVKKELDKFAETGRIPANLKITLYNEDATADSDFDAILIDEWDIAYAVKNSDGTFCFYNSYAPIDDIEGPYAEGFYTIYPNDGYDADATTYYGENYAHAYWAKAADFGKFLAIPEALKTVTATVTDVIERNIANPENDAPYITFKTSAGDLNESIFYLGDIATSAYLKYEAQDGTYYPAKLDFDCKDYKKFNFKFYLDPNGEVVAYEIAETTEYVAYISDFYYVAGETTPAGHNGSTTGWTLYAHCVDLDGNVISIPVETSKNSQVTLDRLPDYVLGLNNGEDAKAVRYFTLQPTGLYEYSEYDYAMKEDITDAVIEAGKVSESSKDYEFVDSTKIFNVSEKAPVITVESIGLAADEGVWVVYDPIKDADSTDYAVTNLFYTDYTPDPATTILYIAEDTEWKDVNADYVTFDAYINGVKTTITCAKTDELLDDYTDDGELVPGKLSTGGFYYFTVFDGYYKIGEAFEGKTEKVTQTSSYTNTIEVDGTDYSIIGKTFIDLSTEDDGLDMGDTIISIEGIAKDTVFFIVDGE